MTFGDRIRELRKAKNLTLSDVAAEADSNFTDLSKIENENLDFAQFPSEKLIRSMATALEADTDELLLLAWKIPGPTKWRVIERPDAFREIAKLDDDTLNKQLEDLIDG